MNELHLFAGAGGGILAGQLLGHRCICAVECEPYAQSVLVVRQNDGSLPPFPIWDDVRTFDGRPWRGAVDIVAGGFPCQDISESGFKQGIDGERSGLWRDMVRIIGEVRPRYVFVENVAALLHRGMGVVLGGLAKLGFDAQWTVLGTANIGGAQPRERVWILAHAQGIGWGAVQPQPRLFPAAPKDSARLAGDRGAEHTSNASRFLWPDQSGLDRVADGMADRVERIRCIGNGQDPRVAAAAFTLLAERLGIEHGQGS